MRISTPTTIEQVAWDGQLEALGATFAGGEALHVTLGELVWWSVEQALANETGQTWTAPADNRRYLLVQVACTLHPPDHPRTHFTEATLTLYLRPRQGAGTVSAHKLFPQELPVEQTGTFKVSLGPDLTFVSGVGVKIGEIGAEIEYRKVFPAIRAFGLGQANPYWEFKHHPAQPLIGCQSVYLVLAAPQDAEGVRLSIEFTATAETRFGPVRLGLPETARAHVSHLINMPSPPEGDSHA